MIRKSAHTEAEKLKEQHHSAQHSHTQYLLASHWLLFELWGFNDPLYLTWPLTEIVDEHKTSLCQRASGGSWISKPKNE
jgi:hypothetical protein